MDIGEIRDKVAAGTLTRRELGRAMAAVGLATVAMPVGTRRGRAQEGEAILFTWAGNDDARLHTAYVEKHGAEPEYALFGDENEAFQKVRVGFAADVTAPCSPMVPQWRDAGLIQPIDTDRLTNWRDVFPSLTTLPGTQFEGQQWFVPNSWGRTSITYRTDMVDWEGEDSYGLLWDERYTGRLAVFDSVDETVFTAAIYAGVDPCNMGDEELDKVMALLEEQKKLLRFYATDETSIVQALASGEVVAALTWDSGFAQLRAEGHPVAYMTPKEGVETWCCGHVLLKDAPHPDKAYDLIDATISPETGLIYLTEFGMGHSNRAAFELVDDEVLEVAGLPRNPETLLNSGVMYCRFKDKDQVIERFDAMMAEF